MEVLSAPSFILWLFPHTKQFLDTSWGSYSSAQALLSICRQYQIPQVKGSVLQDYPCSHFRCQSQAQVVTCVSDPPAIDQGFQHPPPWVWLICQCGSQNSEKLFTYQITGLLQKDRTQEQPDGSDAQSKVQGKGHGASMSPQSMPVSPNLHVFTNPEVL